MREILRFAMQVLQTSILRTSEPACSDLLNERGRRTVNRKCHRRYFPLKFLRLFGPLPSGGLVIRLTQNLQTCDDTPAKKPWGARVPQGLASETWDSTHSRFSLYAFSASWIASTSSRSLSLPHFRFFWTRCSAHNPRK